MHQYVSKCIQNELCKCFVHEITIEVVFITFKVAKIDELLVSLCDGRPCIYYILVMDLLKKTLRFYFFQKEISD